MRASITPKRSMSEAGFACIQDAQLLRSQEFQQKVYTTNDKNLQQTSIIQQVR